MSRNSDTSQPSAMQVVNQLSSPDSDIRFMALTDLGAILANPRFSLESDPRLSKFLLASVIDTVLDNNSEVQNLAVKSLAPLAPRLNEANISSCLSRFSLLLIGESENTSESQSFSTSSASIAAAALKTLISAAPNSSNNARAIRSILLPIVLKDVHQSIDILDVLTAVVHRFGSFLPAPDITNIRTCLVATVDNSKLGAVRRRAGQLLAEISPFLSDTDFEDLIGYLYNCLQNDSAKLEHKRLLFQIFASVARTDGDRLLPYVIKVSTLIISIIEDQQDIDIRDAGLTTIDTFVSLFPDQFKPVVGDLVQVISSNLRFDPNYAVSDDEDVQGTSDDGASDEEMPDVEDDDDDDGNDEYGDELDDDEEDIFTDDEDISWKVRRAAARLTATLASQIPESYLPQLIDNIAPTLLQKFNDREANVQQSAILAVSKIVSSVTSISSLSDSDSQSENSPGGTSSLKRKLADTSPSLAAAESSPNVTAQLVDLPLSKLVNGSLKKVSVKLLVAPSTNPATKDALLNLFNSLTACQNKQVNEELAGWLLPLLVQTMNVPTLKSETLGVTNNLVRHQAYPLLRPHIKVISNIVILGITDPFYKLSWQAINIVSSIVDRLTQMDQQSVVESDVEAISQLLSAILDRVNGQNVDLEVREAAIATVGHIAVSVKISNAQLERVIDSLIARLDQETTLVPILRAIESLYASPIASTTHEAQSRVKKLIPIFISFLNKSNLPVRNSAISALRNICSRIGDDAQLEPSQIKSLVSALCTHFPLQDVAYAPIALEVLESLLKRPDSVDEIPFEFLKLVKSLSEQQQPITGDNLSRAIVRFLEAYIKANPQSSEKVFNLFDETSEPRFATSNALPKALAAITLAGNLHGKVDEFIKQAQAPLGEKQKMKATTEEEEAAQQALIANSLAVLGEIGYEGKLDVSNTVWLYKILQQAQSQNEVNVTAAYTLGNLISGDTSNLLPTLLEQVAINAKDPYLYLVTLKQVIDNAIEKGEQGKAQVSPMSESILEDLFSLNLPADLSFEDCRLAAAEILGRICIVDPQRILPGLQSRLKSNEAALRGIAIAAISYVFNDADRSCSDGLLESLVPEYLESIIDPDLSNQKLSLSSLIPAIHNRPKIISRYLSLLLPLLYQQTLLKPELVREVQMGPFKHKVDEGLDVRKGAYENIYSLLTEFANVTMATSSTPTDTVIGSATSVGAAITSTTSSSTITSSSSGILFGKRSPLDLNEMWDKVVLGLSDDQHDIKILAALVIGRIASIEPGVISRQHRLSTLANSLGKISNVKVKDNAIKQEFEKNSDLQRHIAQAGIIVDNSFRQGKINAPSQDASAWDKLAPEVSKWKIQAQTTTTSGVATPI